MRAVGTARQGAEREPPAVERGIGYAVQIGSVRAQSLALAIPAQWCYGPQRRATLRYLLHNTLKTIPTWITSSMATDSSLYEKGQNTLSLARVRQIQWCLQLRLPVWQPCHGINGCFRLEWEAGLDWNTHIGGGISTVQGILRHYCSSLHSVESSSICMIASSRLSTLNQVDVS